MSAEPLTPAAARRLLRSRVAPYFDFNTGPLGVVLTVVGILYVLGLVLYYGGPFLFVGASAFSALYQVFHTWTALRPLVPALLTIFSALNVTSLPLTFALIVVVGVVAVGSVGFLAVLLASLAQCNTAAAGFGSPCSDLLYCCVFAGTVAGCAGLGPCAPPAPQTPGDLRVRADHTTMIYFTLAFLVFEVAQALLVYLVRQRRFRRQMLAAELLRETLNELYGLGDEGTVVAGAAPPAAVVAGAEPLPPPPPEPAPPPAAPEPGPAEAAAAEEAAGEDEAAVESAYGAGRRGPRPYAMRRLAPAPRVTDRFASFRAPARAPAPRAAAAWDAAPGVFFAAAGPPPSRFGALARAPSVATHVALDWLEWLTDAWHGAHRALEEHVDALVPYHAGEPPLFPHSHLHNMHADHDALPDAALARWARAVFTRAKAD